MAFKKALMTCAAVGALSVAMAASAFAANELTVSQDKTDDVENGKVSITAGLDDASGQMTVLIFAEGADTDEDGLTADEILYIDQLAATTENLFQGMGIRSTAIENGKLKAGTYTVLVGSDAAGATILSGTLTVSAGGRTIQLGECDGLTAAVNAGDALAVLKHASGSTLLTGDALVAAECDGLTAAINAGDALAILKHASGSAPLGTVTVTD